MNMYCTGRDKLRSYLALSKSFRCFKCSLYNTLILKIILACSVLFFLFLFPLFLSNDNNAIAAPVLKDPSFRLDMVVNGLTRPTGISFLAPNDYLVIEEDTGKVKRVNNGQPIQTILDLPVSTSDSRGLLGILEDC